MDSKLGEKRKEGEEKEREGKEGEAREGKGSLVCLRRKGREKKERFIFLLNLSSLWIDFDVNKIKGKSFFFMERF